MLVCHSPSLVRIAPFCELVLSCLVVWEGGLDGRMLNGNVSWADDPFCFGGDVDRPVEDYS
jgi:hypothetical protein